MRGLYFHSHGQCPGQCVLHVSGGRDELSVGTSAWNPTDDETETHKENETNRNSLTC